MVSKYTPGSWRLLDCSTVSKENEGKSGKTAFWITSSSHSTVALLKYSKVRDVKADASLIAAAPDLLSACQRLEWALHLAIQGKPVINADETFAEARSAIAKALG